MLKERAQGDCPRVSIRTLAPPQALQIPGQQLDNLAAGNVKRHDEGNGDVFFVFLKCTVVGHAYIEA